VCTGTPPRCDTDADGERYFGRTAHAAAQRVAVTCRVSSRAQRPEWASQRPVPESFGRGAGIAVVDGLTAIGGSRHFRRPVFRGLMARMERRARSWLPVAHPERLCRFGFDGFACLAAPHEGERRVVNPERLSSPVLWVVDL